MHICHYLTVGVTMALLARFYQQNAREGVGCVTAIKCSQSRDHRFLVLLGNTCTSPHGRSSQAANGPVFPRECSEGTSSLGP